jgi:demethylmenaquinone methyltransferase/2-methoxy-6-polyprenyl-1,4-benzoquinol methylase
VGDAFRLPFADNSFDAVYNTLAAHEFKKISKIIAEAYRVLKPGGRIVLYDFSYPENLLLRYTYLPFVKHIVELGTFFVYDAEGWRKILNAEGFKDIETESLYGASILIRARK